MVTISGTATRRVANPASSMTPPPSSAAVARKAINVGKGMPRVSPNQDTVALNPAAFTQPAWIITGARISRSRSGGTPSSGLNRSRVLS